MPIFISKGLVGVPDDYNIESKRFEDIQSERFGNSMSSRLVTLCQRVEADDNKILGAAAAIQNEQAAFFSDGKKWTIEKRTIEGNNGSRYILGVARQSINPQRLNTQIIKHSPSFISIKDKDLRILHCNWTFAERRGLTVEQCFRKTDLDFWPEDVYPGQAKRFEDVDRSVLSLLPNLEAIDLNPDLDERAKDNGGGIY